MNLRPFHVLMVLWLTAWYGVVVPGHQRGMVLVPGAERQISASGSCCEKREAAQPSCHSTSTNETPASSAPKKKSDPERVKNCAVCAIAGLIDMPPPLELSPVSVNPGLTIGLCARELIALEIPGHTFPFKRGPPVAV